MGRLPKTTPQKDQRECSRGEGLLIDIDGKCEAGNHTSVISNPRLTAFDRTRLMLVLFTFHFERILQTFIGSGNHKILTAVGSVLVT